jgi:hypothetical protein
MTTSLSAGASFFNSSRISFLDMMSHLSARQTPTGFRVPVFSFAPSRNRFTAFLLSEMDYINHRYSNRNPQQKCLSDQFGQLKDKRPSRLSGLMGVLNTALWIKTQ